MPMFMHACEGLHAGSSVSSKDSEFRPVSPSSPPHGFLELSAREGARELLPLSPDRQNKCPVSPRMLTKALVTHQAMAKLTAQWKMILYFSSDSDVAPPHRGLTHLSKQASPDFRYIETSKGSSIMQVQSRKRSEQSK